MNKRIEGYRVPGTNLINFSKFSRENIPKPPHGIPLGQVVRVQIEAICQRITKEVYTGLNGFATLIVVAHHKDCDGTALYHLSTHPVIPPESYGERLKYKALMPFNFHGFGKQSLTPVTDTPLMDLIEWETWKRRILGE